MTHLRRSIALCTWLVACGSSPDDHAIASDGDLTASALEVVPPGEAQATAQIVGMIEQTVRADFASQASTSAPGGGGRTARRDAHGKHHGCVRAKVAVEADLPANLRSSVFVPGREWPAWIRFSNGSGKVQDDHEGDGRGMAIKLVGVPGDKLAPGETSATTQDFLMINHPTFFVRNAADYVDFQRAVTGGSPLRFFFPGFNPLSFRFHELGIVNAIRGKKIPSPLGVQYFSMAPYAFGGRAVKWSARPCRGEATAPDRLSSSPDYLREAMRDELAGSDACFELLVQEQTDSASMPVEDPTIAWTSPLRKLATITIPSQDFSSPARMTYCENLSLSPWHSVPEHRPLGGINRVRRTVYETISRVRHELNGAERREPTDLSVPGEP